jgi:hypothetical protein
MPGASGTKEKPRKTPQTAGHNHAMKRLCFVPLGLAIGAAAAWALPPAGGADPPRWSWQEPHAKVDPKGDLAWTPRPFAFEKGASVRYIDFADGDDANPGDAPARPWKHHPWDPQATGRAAAGAGVHTYVFKTQPGHAGGVLMEKMKGGGYSLTIGSRGRLSFTVKGGGTPAAVESQDPLNDGKWHHAIVEADRRAKTLTVYVDGKKDASSEGIDATMSLANDGDVHVGGTPEGRGFDGTLDFLRIALGTLADADTTIEELFAWEFEGPFLRDFAGRKPAGARRDAGAVEAAE